MNRRLKLFAIPLALGCWAGPAAADVVDRQITDDGDSMRFSDEDLLGQTLSGQGDVLRLRLGPARTLLIRPRVSFVPELSKSVETL